jgi:RimJ/RimL family protein N-acetyltransferase
MEAYLPSSVIGACGVSADSYAGGSSARGLLRDGTPVCIRAIRPDDKERLRIAFKRLSAQSVYRRFFRPITALTPDILRRLTELDFRDHVGLVLTVVEEGGERLIAVARFVRVPSGGNSAEVAVTVADEYQHRGAATLLLDQLVRLARCQGIRELVALVLEGNREIVKVLENSKLPLRQSLEGGVRRLVLSLEAAT